MKSSPRTHRLVVSGYIFREDRVLLLHRTKPPRIWAPPGGHLEVDEVPALGLVREIDEETSLKVEVLQPAGVWCGNLGKGTVVSVDFVCRYLSGEVHLDYEHDEFVWSSEQEILKGQPNLGSHPSSYKTEDFRRAFRLHRCFSGIE